jgi:DNA primase
MEPKEEIKQRLPIEVVVGEYVELKRAGRNYKGLSPFNNEKTPSFIVSPEKAIWHDFSSGKGGDIFSFVMEVEGMDFREALKHLAGKAGVELKEYSQAQKKDVELKKRIFQINELATKYFQTSLVRNPDALSYLKNRGITKQAILDFKLGYGPNSAKGLSNLLLKHKFKLDEIQKAGVITVKNDQPYDIFRGRIMFPFINTKNEYLGFTARLVDPNGLGPKYLNTPQTIAYNKSDFLYGLNLAKETIRKQNQVVLLEGNMDVVASSQAGLKEVVAASGTAITPLQINELKRFTENLILCLDTDSAGVNATVRSLEIIAKTDIKAKVAEIPAPYKDPDELLKDTKNGGLERWKIIIQEAEDAYIWMIEKLATDIDLKSPAQKGSYASDILRTLNLIQNPVAQESYKKYLAEKLDVSLSSLEELANSAPPKRFKKPKIKPKVSQDQPDIQSLQKLFTASDRFLSILLNLNDPPALQKVKKIVDPEDFLRPQSKSVYMHISECTLNDSKATIDSELEDYLAQLNLIDGQLLEFSGQDTVLIDLLIEQFNSMQLRLKEYRIGKLKHKLKQTPKDEQNAVLQQIQQINSQATPKLEF